MKIIADSSTSRTEWVLVEGAEIVERAFTAGLNPYFLSRREISHIVRLELPEAFFKRRWEHVYFYGAGCASKDKCKTMESSLVAQFKTPVTVNSDLLGAARGLLERSSGLACILGTGSNSCLYDGDEIVKNVPPLGYILGDEGSATAMGKTLIANVLKGIAPAELSQAFFERFGVSPNVLLEQIYSAALPSRTLSQYSIFLSENLSHPYVRVLVYDSLMSFFTRNIAAYDYKAQPICFVGSTGVAYESILRQVAEDFGVKIDKIISSSIPGLVNYHATEFLTDNINE